MTKPPKGVGLLFPKNAHDEFMGLTRSRYNGMEARIKRKKLPPLGFTLDEFRERVLSILGGKEDGFVQCKYCCGFFGVQGITGDHAIPLSRGGSTGLDNIDFPCRRCNQMKGSMVPQEFLQLLKFLEGTIPLARMDVLLRLEKANQLAAGAFANQAVINDLKEKGIWAQAQKERRDAKKAKKSGLKKF